MKKSKYKKVKLLPYEVIEEATKGDYDAIDKILTHFGAYITTLATRTYRDDYGNSFSVIDEELRNLMIVKYIEGILSFKA